MSEKEPQIIILGYTQHRLIMYEVLLRVFASLPDEALVGDICDPEFVNVLQEYASIATPGMEQGLALVKQYCTGIDISDSASTVTELAVDRTRLLRAAGDQRLRPPYQSLYCTNISSEKSILAVKEFYRQAGLALDESVCELPDYLCIELDFMCQLCQREQEEFDAGMDAAGTRRLEEEFIRWHLGSWIGDYCLEATKYSKTPFYQGFLAVLDIFIRSEREYLHNLISNPVNTCS